MELVEHKHHFFDGAVQPALKIKGGDVVVFKTCDPFNGTARNMDDVLAKWNSGKKDPLLTGPVFIEGAKPGDTLLVEILDIQFPESGFQIVGPNRGVVKDEIGEWTYYEVVVKDNRIMLPCGIQVPARGMVGTLGNAPSAGVPDNVAAPTGGNLDVPAVEKGAVVYIPIEVEGALFSLADVHARQGDGEVAGAPEMPALVTVRFGFQAGRHSGWLMVFNDGWWYSPCCHEREAEAAESAVWQNAEYIAGRYGIRLKDAIILLTMLGRISLSRTGRWGVHYPVVTSSFNEKEVERAIEKYYYD